MTNKQKINKTRTIINEVRERYQKDLEKQKVEAKKIKSQKEAVKKMMILTEFEFPKQKPFVTFFSETYGYHTQLICNRKKRIQAVPLCFLVTLYEQELRAVFPKKNIQIPYTLRGFWKMEKAVELVDEFVRLQNECERVLLWEKRRLSKENKNKAKACAKILNEFVSIEISHNGMTTTVSYRISNKEKQLFKLNKENVKLDVVPLCKMLTCYYARVLRQIDHYVETYAYKWEKEKFETIKTNLSKFMEKYFTVKTIC